MPGIEDARTGLDELSGQVEQYGQDILDITNEEPYDSLVARAQRAGQLATELAGLLDGIGTDINIYLSTLNHFGSDSENCQSLKDAASEIVAGGPAMLGGVPGEIGELALYGVTIPIAFVNKHAKPVASYAANAKKAANGIEKLSGALAQQRTNTTEEVQQRTAQIKAHIERGKTNL